MEELKARIELLKEQNPIKIQDLERKFGLLKFELQEAKKILERQEIALADVKGEWIKPGAVVLDYLAPQQLEMDVSPC